MDAYICVGTATDSPDAGYGGGGSAGERVWCVLMLAMAGGAVQVRECGVS
jgi:hypothetical protein